MGEEDFHEGGTFFPPHTGDIRAQLNELIEHAIEVHIRHDLFDSVVFETEDQYWEYFAETDVEASDDPAYIREFYESENLIERPGNGTMIVHYPGVATEHQTLYFKGEAAWQSIRDRMSGSLRIGECLDSLSETGFDSIISDVRDTRVRLSTTEDNVEARELLEAGSIPGADSGSSDSVAAMEDFYRDLNLPSDWQSVSTVGEALAPWTGAAAQTFHQAFLGRFPSILTGQAVTARVLEDSLVMMRQGHYHAKNECLKAIPQVQEILDMYPNHSPSSSGFNWGEALGKISGLAGFASAVAAPFPGPGTALSATAGIIASGANLARTFYDEDSAQQEVKSRQPLVDGDSVLEIMWNFEEVLRTFLDTLDNMENFLYEYLTAYQDQITSDLEEVRIHLTWFEDIYISGWNAYFEPKDMSIAAIDESSSPEDVMDIEYFGDIDVITAADVQNLVKAGVEYLPEIADSFGDMIRGDYSMLVESALTRERLSSHGAMGAESISSGGPLVPAWESLDSLLQGMLRSSQQNSSDGGRALVAAAGVFAATDGEIRRELEEISIYAEELGLA